MENHNTHIVSEQSKEEHGYKYDNFGNVIVDSIDDLIYDKFVDVKRKPKHEKETNTKKFIKDLITKDEYPPITPEYEEKKESSESEQNETEENVQKRKSLININVIDDGKSENEEKKEESQGSEESEKENQVSNIYNFNDYYFFYFKY